MWCNAPLNGHTPILFEDLPSKFTQQLSALPFKHCRTLWRTIYPTTYHWLSIIYNVKELEVLTGHLPIKMALANFTCQVCILWLKATGGEVKTAISPFSAQRGTIILPLRAILAGVYVRHMGKSLHSALWVFIHLDGSLIATSKQYAQKCQKCMD